MNVGDTMKIGVDKNSYKITNNEHDFIYLFDDEPIKKLLKTGLHCINYEKCDYVDINLTDYNIECLKKAKITDKDYDKLPPKINYKIGIIVPNCNYEHTLEKCLNSIFNQTYKNFEIIFVDDCSTDNSVEVVNKTYQSYLFNTYGYYDDSCTLEKMKVIKLKQKRYNGGARNEAYLHLSDDVDYVYYVDSDDWLYNETVLDKINNRLQNKPDVLFVGMAQSKDNKITTCFIPEYNDKYEAFSGWSGSCGKVIKKSLATRQECLYNEGTLKEDKNQHCRICIYMNSFELLKKPVYVWNRENYKSVTTIRDNILWGTSTIRHYADTMQLALSVKGKDNIIDSLMEERLYKTKREIEQGGDRQW